MHGLNQQRKNTHPCTAKPPPIDGEEGGVAVSFRLAGEPWDGGDVDGTARLTATPSSASPRQQTQNNEFLQILQYHDVTYKTPHAVIKRNQHL